MNKTELNLETSTSEKPVNTLTFEEQQQVIKQVLHITARDWSLCI